MTENIKNELKVLNKAIRSLEKDNLDIWVKTPKYEGYGFKVICDSIYIDVYVSLFIDEPNEFIVSKYERDGNIFDTLKDKALDEKRTTNVELVESIIREML